jgi:hypothetical protein
MSTPGTATVEFDEELLNQLRQGAPGKTDRELLEELAIIPTWCVSAGRWRRSDGEEFKGLKR